MDGTNATSVASTEQYISALLSLRDQGRLPDSHVTMLRAQCSAPQGAMTATQLAEAAGFGNYNAANLQYGKVAKKCWETHRRETKRAADRRQSLLLDNSFLYD